MRFFTDTHGIRDRAERPHGRLPSKNKLNEMIENTEEYVEKLRDHSGVLGITLTGGLSRGYGDELSEIDLNIYLTPKACVEWSKGRGPLPQGDHQGIEYHMDVSFLDLEKEKEAEWGLLKKWDASYTEILYDPRGEIKNLLDKKDVFTADEKYSLALRNYLDCTYFADIVVRQWTLREDPMVANQMINKAIPSLCNLLFLANDEYPPFEKWLVNYSHSLEWKPDHWEKRLKQITIVEEITIEEAQRRSDMLMQLYREVWGKVVREEYCENGLLELDALETLEYVIKKEPSIEEFTEEYNIKQLGYEVLYKLADIVEKDGKEVIVFDKKKYLEEKEQGFPSFLDWNIEVLRHIKLSQ